MSKALKELYSLLWTGQVPNWDLSKVRELRENLSRHLVVVHLVQNHWMTFSTFQLICFAMHGRKLKPVECHDLVCKIAEIVVVVEFAEVL